MNDLNQIPAGWYDDPSGADRQRFWDGQQWTDQYAYRTADTATPSGTPGMAFTKKTAAIWGGVGVVAWMAQAGSEEGASTPYEIGVPFSFAMMFGIVMFSGWVIGRVRVLRSGNKSSATLTPGSLTPDAPVSTPASVVEDDGATVVASLRRLKALHDDGILTNDEYETKRKALTDEL